MSSTAYVLELCLRNNVPTFDALAGICTCGGALGLSDGAQFGPCSTVAAGGSGECAGPLLQRISDASPELSTILAGEAPEASHLQPLLSRLRPWDEMEHAVNVALMTELRMLRRSTAAAPAMVDSGGIQMHQDLHFDMDEQSGREVGQGGCGSGGRKRLREQGQRSYDDLHASGIGAKEGRLSVLVPDEAAASPASASAEGRRLPEDHLEGGRRLLDDRQGEMADGQRGESGSGRRGEPGSGRTTPRERTRNEGWVSPNAEAKAEAYDRRVGEFLAKQRKSTGRTDIHQGAMKTSYNMPVPQVHSLPVYLLRLPLCLLHAL